MIGKKKILFLIVFILLGCFCLLAYWNSLNNPFIWDDQALVVKNPLIKSWNFWPKVLTNDLFFGVASGSNFYRPMQTFSFMWDYTFWQLDPYGYHITNIILQALISFLVFFLFYLLSGNFGLSFSSAALFSVSAIHTESVTYISGRAELLMGLFLISSLILFIKSRNIIQPARIVYFSLSLILFALGLLSKELSVAFPLVLLAYLFYYFRDKFSKPVYLAKVLLPFILLDVLYLILRFTLFNFFTLRPAPLTKYPFLIRLTVLPEVILTYFKLLILPVNLHLSWEIKRPVSFLGFFSNWFLLGVMVVFALHFLKYNQKRKLFSFFLAWFLIFLLPQSGIFPINAFVAEHFIYLSSISFFLLCAYFLRKFLRKWLFILAITILIIFNISLTAARNFEWQDPFIFYQKIIQLSPNSIQALNNLGLEYEYKHKYNEAINEYRKALEVQPDLLEAHSNLANLYFKLGKLKESKKEYAIVEKLAPAAKAGEIQNNIGCVYEVEGLLDQAVEKYRLALKLDPTLKFSHFNIGRVYLTKGNFELASREILESLPEIKPDKRPLALKVISGYVKSIKSVKCTATFYNELGIRFAKEGFFDAAIAAFNRIIEIEPKNTDAHFNLGLIYWKLGLRREAVFELKTVLKINPNHFQAKNLLKEIILKK
ncbi:MAG: tetratricopeptide repeat protein [Candidatus Omnitrophica bacterium]|nr:tetratricopeptide repeat protein [Candidatus Omnitrophota bacterium]